MHYIVMRALDINRETINSLAAQSDLYICSRPEEIVNSGEIDVKAVSPYFNIDRFVVGIQNLGFMVRDCFPLGNDCYRIIIGGYMR